ncbi:hypothetical protein BDQ12DRAFT_610198 [Crucibulum laeve]|uniref:RING-type domain-containing protein n=1 Tax=Crucibulum laeve TaxID=68775 RepID=A0A5C3LT01_9AGAR|nr:hypothetical protein BDQ12DRAFT_610198 [Crucibulum laeve]
MLVLGPDSACDVCLDGYDNDTKLPYSIQCGHVFCSQCIPSLPRDTCPICRASFSRSEVRRLHVDLDSVKATPEALEAKRLQAAIAKIANEGSSEQNLRQFIQEGKAFLTSQPRAMYKELRTSLKMISYMCDVRSTLKSRERELENISKQVQQLAQLQAENGLLQKQLQSSKKKRQEERDQALAEQLTLKDHAAKAHAAYETMVE